VIVVVVVVVVVVTAYGMLDKEVIEVRMWCDVSCHVMSCDDVRWRDTAHVSHS
jgi:hypothetical protein